MKKLLALVLCVAMICSVCVFTTSASYWSKVQGHGWYWDSNTAYGYLTDAVDSRPGNDVGYEYDIVHLEDAVKEDGVIPSGIGFSTSAGNIYVARTGVLPGYSTKELSGLVPYSGAKMAGPTCQQHVKVEFTGAGMTTWIDGVKVDTKAGVTCTNSRWFFQYEGVAAIDNLRVYTPSTGDTVAFCDFEGGSNLAGSGLGSSIAFDDSYDLYGFNPGDKVGAGDGTNVPIAPNKPIPTADVVLEYDIAFVSDDTEKGTCLIAPDVYDGSYGRLIVSRFGVGIGNAYGSADVVKAAVTPLAKVEDAGWKNQHHVKMASTADGMKVWVDGGLVYDKAGVNFTNGWTGHGETISWLNLGMHSGLTAIKDLKLYVNSTGEVLFSFDGSDAKGMDSAAYGSSFAISEVPNFIEEYPTVNMITGYTQLKDGEDNLNSEKLTDKQVYTMDLALVPNEKGEAEFTVWGGLNQTNDRAGIKLDANTGKATVGVSCDNTGKDGHGDHGDFAAPVTVDWGKGTYTNMHNVVFTFDGVVTIAIDGEVVYNSGLNVPTNGNNYAVVNAESGTPVIDNFSLESGDYVLATDFEAGSAGIGGGSLKTIYPCNDNHSFSKFYATTTAPTCTANGVATAICEICGEATTTRSIGALGHNYTSNWDSANNVTADKREYNCKRCGEVAYTSLPSSDEYTGTYTMYVDCKNKDMTENVLGLKFPDGGYMSADGHYSSGKSEQNYQQLGQDEKLNPAAGYVHSVDLRLNGFFTGNDAKYGNTFYFWCGGSNGMVAMAGVDFANQEAYIVPTTDGTFDEQRVSISAGVGEWHTYSVRFITDWDEWYATLEFLVDGEVVISVDEDFIEDSVMVIGADEGKTEAFPILRFFGVDVSFDNYVRGSYDFAWTNGAELLGDVNGDGKVNMLDLLRAKKYVVGLVGEESVNLKNGDLDYKRNGINGTDISLLKRLISTL